MRILLVDDDELSRDSLELFLSEQMGYDIVSAQDAEDALRFFSVEIFPVVLTDMKMPGMTGIELLKEVKKISPATEVIIMTGFGDMKTSIEALRLGASDYILKPVNIEELAINLKRIEEFQNLKIENTSLKDTIRDNDVRAKENDAKLFALRTTLNQASKNDSIGIFSHSMKQIVQLCENYHKERDVPVIIQGETGTGKEVIAKLLHNGVNTNSDKPFVPVNCAAIPSHLFESELFGYVEGAFTGARKNGAAGKFELAQGGTIFLDEIGEMPIEFQSKLLRALQEREIYRVGGDKLIKLDVRVICATNRDLKLMIEENKFRSDLYFRLNLGQINIPSLKDRKEEIVPLAQMFLEKFAYKRRKSFRFISEEAREILEEYLWPGNIRELQNTIERVVLLYDDELLLPQHIKFLQNNGVTSDEPANGYFLKNGNVSLPDDSLSIEDLEKEIVSKALKKFDDNKTKVAEYLGISRSALRSRLKKL